MEALGRTAPHEPDRAVLVKEPKVLEVKNQIILS